MSLCNDVSSYVREHIVDVQFVHHQPDDCCYNQGIQRTDYRKTEDASRLSHNKLTYSYSLISTIRFSSSN